MNALVQTAAATVIPPQAASDQHLVQLWLHGRSPHTRRAYRRDISAFFAFTGRPLAAVTLADLQAFHDSLGVADSSRARSLSAVKSLLTFGQRIGYLVYNVGAAMLVPKTKNTLAGRILDREAVIRMIALETDPRNQAMLALAYDAGVRVSELVSISGADLVKRENGTAQITVFGKGNKTRVVLIGPKTYSALQKLVPADPTHPLFRSRSGRPLDQSMLWRIVRKAARRVGIDANVSTHWLRHACASHSLDAGAPVHLVRAQLGHASLETTTRYSHARPDDGLFRYLGN